MDYKISLKNPDPNGEYKWLNVGNFKLNKFGKMSLGLRVTEELAKLILETETGKWINLAAFEEGGKVEQKEPRSAAVKSAPKDVDLDDDILF
jgi:hypothetical protein